MSKGKMFMDIEKGCLTCGYSDYSDFGDLEVTYKLDQENTEKLENALKEKHTGSLKEMMIEEFGEYMDKCSFAEWCDSKGIVYKKHTWVD